jgi:glycosyltransferase involved in cell wall biosynthesis
MRPGRRRSARTPPACARCSRTLRLMPSQPRVSVIIPAYNAEGTLRGAVESLVAQTYPSWEVVVAVDVSSDSTLAVARELARALPERVRVLDFPAHVGSVVARNEALFASRDTELIALLDADDIFLPRYLERQIELYDEHRAKGGNPGIVACNAYYEHLDGRRVGTFDLIEGWVDPVTYDDMIRKNYLYVGALFPRSVLTRVGILDPTCWAAEDWDLWLRIMEAGYDVVVNREPLAAHRLHSTSLTRNSVRTADAGIAVCQLAMARGAVNRRQRQAIRRQIRHFRAIRYRELVRQASRRRGWRRAIPLALPAVLYGGIAFLQAPSRWREWTRDSLRLVSTSHDA